MMQVTDEMLKAAANVFCENGLHVSLPQDGDLDDVERERYETLKAAISASLAAMWHSTADELPKKPGLKNYEYVDCLIVHKGEVIKRPWNCEHLCWDDEEYDDFFCDPKEPTAWMPLPSPPKAEG